MFSTFLIAFLSSCCLQNLIDFSLINKWSSKEASLISFNISKIFFLAISEVISILVSWSNASNDGAV